MKTIAVFVALVAVTLAAPQVQKEQQVYVVKETPSNNIGLDGYQFAYEQNDGQTRQESAQVQLGRTAEEADTLRVTGSYSYVAPDGLTYTVTYVADENGFQPQGAHLPVGPQ